MNVQMKHSLVMLIGTVVMLPFLASCGVSPRTVKEEKASVDAKLPRMLAHRGGRLEQDENTLAAFKATYNAGCHAFETDIHMTGDGDYVISHDSNLKRRCGVDLEIGKSPVARIKATRTEEGNPIPTLDELLGYFKGCKDLYVEWEMKTNAQAYPEPLLHKFCDEIYAKITAARPADALYVFTSFDTRPLQYIHAKHPDAELGLIVGKPCCKETVDQCVSLGLHRLMATLDGTSREAVKYAHEKGVILNLWPGNAPEDTHLAALLGADYLCTDCPRKVMEYAREHKLPIKH